MMSNRKAILISIITGFLASTLNFLYISAEKSKLNLGPTIEILTAKSDLPANSIVEAGSLDSKKMPRQFAPPNYILATDLQAITGQNTKSQISAGQPILWSHFRVDRMPSLVKLNEGDRAFTIAVNEVTGVGGVLNHGNRVDIICTFQSESGKQISKTLLQNVTVLSTHNDMENLQNFTSQTATNSYSHVTLIVTQEEAQLLAFASSQGEIYLSMRDANDLHIDRDLKEISSNSMPKSELTAIEKRLIKPLREERKEPIIIIGGAKQSKDDNQEW